MSERSHAYPSHTISEMVEFTQKIYSKYGSSLHTKREDIAKALNLAEVTIQSDCSTAVQYGLLEMKSKIGYKPTPLFTSIYKPLNDTEKSNSLIQALSNPELYAQLLSQFKDDIIPVDGLPTILFRSYHIAEKVSTKAANIFIENLKYLNLLDNEGKLRLVKNIVSENNTQEPLIKTSETALPIVTTPMVNNSETDNISHRNNGNNNNGNNYTEDSGQQQFRPLTFNILLKKKRTAQLVIPQDAQKEDLETIKNWISLMKDSFE